MASQTKIFAVVSDIHGNLPALNAVLDDAKSRGINEFIFAGDYCLSGPFPDECIAALISQKNAHIVRGNEEKYLINLIGKDQDNWTDGQMQVTYWCFRQITQEHLQFLTALPHTLEFMVNGVKVHLSHDSAAWIGDCEFRLIGPDVLAKRYEGMDITLEYYRQDVHHLFSHDPGFQGMLPDLEEGIYLFGHSHVQWNRQDTDRNIFLINPGSCGLPLDFIHGSVPYTVLSISENGAVSIEEIRVPFDKQGYAKVLKNSEQYTEATVWTKVITKEWLKTHEHMTFFLEFVEQYAQKTGDTRRPFAVESWEKAYEIWDNTLSSAENAKESRPELTRDLDSRTFREYYYLKEELAAFCRNNHLPSSGGKHELTERIAGFLDTGDVRQPVTRRPAARKAQLTDISRDSIIERNFVCTEMHRAFFKKEIGNSFSFNVLFQQWLKAHAGKTYADAVDAYYEILEKKKTGKASIGRQFEYNTYIRDFFADNTGKTLDEAIRCWKYKKRLKGRHRYERSDLTALEEK